MTSSECLHYSIIGASYSITTRSKFVTGSRRMYGLILLRPPPHSGVCLRWSALYLKRSTVMCRPGWNVRGDHKNRLDVAEDAAAVEGGR